MYCSCSGGVNNTTNTPLLTSDCVAFPDPRRWTWRVWKCFYQTSSHFFTSRFNGQQYTWRLRSTVANERALRHHPGQKIHGFTVKEVGVVGEARFWSWRNVTFDLRLDLVTCWSLLSYLWVVSAPDLSSKWSHVGVCCLIFRWWLSLICFSLRWS